MKVRIREDVTGNRSAIIAFIAFIITLILVTPALVIDAFPIKETSISSLRKEALAAVLMICMVFPCPNRALIWH